MIMILGIKNLLKKIIFTESCKVKQQKHPKNTQNWVFYNQILAFIFDSE